MGVMIAIVSKVFGKCLVLPTPVSRRRWRERTPISGCRVRQTIGNPANLWDFLGLFGLLNAYINRGQYRQDRSALYCVSQRAVARKLHGKSWLQRPR
jgi:hypothetical protein